MIPMGRRWTVALIFNPRLPFASSRHCVNPSIFMNLMPAPVPKRNDSHEATRDVTSAGIVFEETTATQSVRWVAWVGRTRPTWVATRREVYLFQAFETSCDFVTSVSSKQPTEATLGSVSN